MEPNATGPRSNLAELFTRLAENIARQYQQNPQQAPPNLRERIQDYLLEAENLRQDEFVNFERDASYAPENAAVQYRYGLALYRNDQLDEAVKVLRKVHDLEPRTPVYMIALSRLLQTTGEYDQALKIAQKLIEIEPQHQGFVEELKEQIKKQGAEQEPTPRIDSSEG